MQETLNYEHLIADLQQKLHEKEQELLRSQDMLDLLDETSKPVRSEIELENLIQRITDKATQLSGASFGAFFYHVEVDRELVLYTISGIPKEIFSEFAIPGVPDIFKHTFEGTGIVRYDDVTEEKHFGKHPPFYKMPEGHLPIKSYLAVPVISLTNNELLGGLFLGHEKPRVFSEKEEKIVKGIAMQSAIAMGNITSRKKVEEALQHTNTLITTIADNASLALFLLNKDGVCTYMNPAAIEMTGFKLSDVQDETLLNYLKPEGTTLLDSASLVNLHEKIQGEAIFIGKNGESYPVFFTASPVIEDNVLVQIVLEVRDTTEEKRIHNELREKDKKIKEQLEIQVKERTAELEKINDELMQFTSIASHDLKEPIRKISIFSNMLKERLQGITQEKDIKYLDNIIRSSHRMMELINDLLTFSRITNTQQFFVPVDLNEIIDSSITDFELLIEEKQAVFHIERLPMMEGAPLQLGHVFHNLISNSLKFADPVRQLNITVRSEPVDEGSFRIIYSDTGIGFESKYGEQIFNVFQRLHTRNMYEGTGIGLSIVKKIVMLHNGSVRALGLEGEGATFEIIFPYKQKSQPVEWTDQMNVN